MSDSTDRPDMRSLIPLPASIRPADGLFTLTAEAVIWVEPGSPELAAIGRYLADRLDPATGFDLAVRPASGGPRAGDVLLTTRGGDRALGDEGYVLTVAPDSVTAVAYRPAGLFWAAQTIRQLLPPAIERPTVQPGPWQMACGTIRDYPRCEWRGIMLDVARHFFGPHEVRRVIDLMAYYKLNRLHLHLSDDQGWRIEIEKWPNLATCGGSTAVDGDSGGYFTQQEYAEILAYAQSRYVTVVPEIDMPGHTNAALASCAELNCDGIAPPLYTGIEVGFSSLCVHHELTYRFVDDVIGELAALTPGPYLHIGGDEAKSTSAEDYQYFVERVQAIVLAHGKQMIGWEEIAQAELDRSTIVQLWYGEHTTRAVQQGARIIMSPASRAYLDMQYNESSPLGLHWAGYVEVEDAYDWDPAKLVEGVGEADVLGVEAPLWSETLRTIDDVEYMAFPRLVGLAEIGWSPQASRSWSDYRGRLADHGLRLEALGVNYYRSPQVEWPVSRPTTGG